MVIETVQDIRKEREEHCPECDLCNRDGICKAMFFVKCPECKKTLSAMGESVDDVLHYGCMQCAHL